MKREKKKINECVSVQNEKCDVNLHLKGLLLHPNRDKTKQNVNEKGKNPANERHEKWEK